MLLCVRVVCLRGVFVVRSSSSMKRGKKAEEAVADGENDNGSGITACINTHSKTCFINLYISDLLDSFIFHLTATAKKAKKAKEPEAPVLYDDPPDKMTSKDGREANMKITSWNVDGLRAWVKKKGLDVSLQRP